MGLQVHQLTGCTPSPLAHYLKALGVLRIIGQQADRHARGWWQDGHFLLMTVLDNSQLEAHFLERYSPTPFVSPWNKGSGFYEASDPALAAIEFSTAPRFEQFRVGISAARAQLADLSTADARVRTLKARTKARKGMSADEVRGARELRHDLAFKAELASANKRFKELKEDLFAPCLRSWRGAHRMWLDAALVLLDGGRPAWPALLGTGGNDGRLDFTNNAMQRLGDLFDLSSPAAGPRPGVAALLAEALWGSRSRGLLEGAAIGQFLPGRAGGANCTTGAGGDSHINPWDFILMLEGAIMFSSRATRRLDSNAMSRASAPFAIRSHAVGHGTRGAENADRGEQWMPIWHQPADTASVSTLLSEGRVQMGRRVAHRPIEVVRAASRLGVARGVSGFLRFGYLERNGQAKIAVPLGRIDIKARPQARILDDIAPWLERLDRVASRENSPARLRLAEGALADAAFAAVTHDGTPERWQAVLLAAVAVEAVQLTGAGFEAGPIPPLAPDWIRATNDGTPEWRLARALGSAATEYRGSRGIDPVRHHWLPLTPDGSRFQAQERRLLQTPRCVISGRDAMADLAALVERRLVEAAHAGKRSLPLVAARGCGAHPVDLADFVAGKVDVGRTLALARAFMAIRWSLWRAPQRDATPSGQWPDEAWMALRLAHLPFPIETDRFVRTDESIIRRLMAGDGTTAIELALRRLRAGGLQPPLQGACAGATTARLWAACLAFPIDQQCARTMALYFAPKNSQEIR